MVFHLICAPPDRCAPSRQSRTHAGILRLADRIGAHVGLAQSAGGILADEVDDLLACLYGLYALLRLHFVQEEENYFTLAEDEPMTSDTAQTRRPSEAADAALTR